MRTLKYLAALYLLLSSACPDTELVIRGEPRAGAGAFECTSQMCGLGAEPGEALDTCGTRENINSECRCIRPGCCEWQWSCVTQP